MAVGASPFEVSLNAQDYVTSTSFTTYTPQAVTLLTPPSGPPLGSTTVSVAHLAASSCDARCRFEGVAVVGATTDGSGDASVCVSPPLPNASAADAGASAYHYLSLPISMDSAAGPRVLELSLNAQQYTRSRLRFTLSLIHI